ncbi:MAG: processing peptidase [Ignavibacteria bacterium]|nr:MAG: processing peptidase [Ignavibacteria bacterium]KAF0156887.1 MAG: processing peptidase [Ignavibacteria bacterium]
MKRLVIFFLLLSVTANLAQIDRSKLPAPGPAPEVKIGNAETFVLANGLKVFVVTNHKLPQVTFSLMLDRDAVYEGKNAGYVTAAGQLLRTGTKTRSKDKLDEEVDFLGANLNASSTSVFASGLSKYTEKLIDLMADVVLNPEFKQEELDKINKQTLSGLAFSKDDPDAIANRVKGALIYGKEHPYGEFETEESIKSITLDQCKQYHETYFRPNIAYLAIVGDIKLAKAKSLAEKYFGKWMRKDVPKNSFANPKAPIVNKISVVDKAGAVQSVINICYPVDLPVGSDDAMKVKIANMILGGSATGRLFVNLREDKAYTYGAYSSINPDKLVGSFSASTKVRTSVTDSAITEILNEMKKIRNEKVSEKELETAKALLSGDFIRSLERPATLANFAINTAIYNLPKDYYKNYLKNLSAINVDDIQSIAKKYIKPNNANILVVGSADDIVKNLKVFSPSSKVDYRDIYGEVFDPNVKKAPEGLTAEQVVAKYVDAIGGRTNLEKIQDETLKMIGSMQGMNINITITRKAPNKMYQLVDFGVGQQKTLFDGEKAKINAMGQEQEVTGAQLEEMKVESTLNSYLYYDNLGVKLELGGMEALNGKNSYKVNLVFPSGKKSVQYYDVKSGLLVKTSSSVESPQGAMNISVEYADYKDVNGVKVAHKVIQGTPMGSIELTVTSVERNTNPSNDLFK